MTGNLVADEGMWLYNRPPSSEWKTRYQYNPSAELLENMQKSSLRFNDGGSGSFISSNGLVLTNHHVASETIQELSTAENNYVENGFLAKTQADEGKAPGLSLDQLVLMEDHTAPVIAAMAAEATSEGKSKAFEKMKSNLELQCEVKGYSKGQLVRLFYGAEYHLYCYKTYRDVRLVFAPETKIGFFGGDPDNFEFPRYNLDMAIFRVYENGVPAKTDHFLKWSKEPLKEGDLALVSGHPGRTQRIYTADAVEFLRDTQFPFLLNSFKRLENSLIQYSQKSDENKRQTRDELFGVQNSRKAFQGMVNGLQDPRVVRAKRERDQRLTQVGLSDPTLRENLKAFSQIAEAQKVHSKLLKRLYLLEGRRAGAMPMAFNSPLYGYARTILRLAQEDLKPNAERLSGYQDAERAELVGELLANSPIYKSFEAHKLADSISFLGEQLGINHPLVLKVLNGKSPIDRANELVTGTELQSAEVREFLISGQTQAEKKERAQRVLTSQDPMLVLARSVDPSARKLFSQYAQKVVTAEAQGYASIGKLIAATFGTNTYPDATFTLRIAYGEVKGLGNIPFSTTVGGAFEHEKAHGAKDPWVLPQSWHTAKSQLDLSSQFNFMCTADIIGGNSGSPVINRTGELIGLIFDGNIESLTSNYESHSTHRAVSVSVPAMLEALEKIYGATDLVQQISS